MRSGKKGKKDHHRGPQKAQPQKTSQADANHGPQKLSPPKINQPETRSPGSRSQQGGMKIVASPREIRRRASATQSWVVQPRDTLIVNDGRPIGGVGLVRSLDLPWPSTIAGFARTAIGIDDDGAWRKDKATGLALQRDVSVQGPWLVSLGDERMQFFPAPRDIIWHADDAEGLRGTRLSPQAVPDDCHIDEEHRDLGLLQPCQPLPEGKASSGPTFWSEIEIGKWLVQPANTLSIPKSGSFGLKALLHEERTHVAIDDSTGTAKDGMLFTTDSVRYLMPDGTPLGVGFTCEDGRLWEGPFTLGGERRLSYIHEGPAPIAMPSGLVGALAGARRVRLVLLTPSIFDEGSIPSSIFGVRVVAAVVGRPQIVSGWNYAENKPKASYRMAPAGSVYWLELPEGTDANSWVREHWRTCCADNDQHQRDGFGLCVMGVA